MKTDRDGEQIVNPLALLRSWERRSPEFHSEVSFRRSHLPHHTTDQHKLSVRHPSGRQTDGTDANSVHIGAEAECDLRIAEIEAAIGNLL